MVRVVRSLTKLVRELAASIWNELVTTVKAQQPDQLAEGLVGGLAAFLAAMVLVWPSRRADLWLQSLVQALSRRLARS